jgi:hypothetical protein
MSDAPGAGDAGRSGALTAGERERLAALAGAESLADLVALTGAESEHAAYMQAKEEWSRLWERRQRADPAPSVAAGELPGESVTVGDATVHVHGVTHAGTETEREFLRERVGRLLDSGAAVYVEQGLRQLFFAEMGVCEMDDYRWALARCETVDRTELDQFAEASSVPVPVPADRLDGLSERLRHAAYALIEDYSDVYGEGVARRLGSIASTVLTDHEGLATGEEYEAFALRQQAVADPSRLGALQAYYRRAFLPAPVEREWVRRHDPDLELVTHARNARMADYAVYHHADAAAVHLVVGAAHGPGVVYYLRQHRDGERSVADFELA